MSEIKRLTEGEINMILEDLKKLPFVNWDRFFKNEQGIVVYGWIKREDAHEDYVQFTYTKEKRDIKEDGVDDYYTFEWSSSSAKWSKEINKRLDGEDDDHSDCQRVEDFFEIENVIKLRRV